MAWNVGWPLNLKLSILRCADSSYFPQGVTLSVLHHVISEPAPRNDQWPEANLLAYMLTILCTCRTDLFVVRICPIDVVEHRQEDNSSLMVFFTAFSMNPWVSGSRSRRFAVMCVLGTFSIRTLLDRRRFHPVLCIDVSLWTTKADFPTQCWNMVFVYFPDTQHRVREYVNFCLPELDRLLFVRQGQLFPRRLIPAQICHSRYFQIFVREPIFVSHRTNSAHWVSYLYFWRIARKIAACIEEVIK